MTSPTKVVEEVLRYKDLKSTTAMKAGLSQEPVIIKEYIEEKAKNGICVSEQECGFFVRACYGLLRTSPDGIVYEVIDNESSGLLELKYILTNDSESFRDALLRKRICVNSDNYSS